MKIEVPSELLTVLGRIADGLDSLCSALQAQPEGKDDFLQVVSELEKTAADLRRKFRGKEFYFLGSLEYAEVAKMRCAWTEDWKESLQGPVPKVLHRKEDSVEFFFVRRTPLGIIYANLT